jgi:hypothetical protein
MVLARLLGVGRHSTTLSGLHEGELQGIRLPPASRPLHRHWLHPFVRCGRSTGRRSLVRMSGGWLRRRRCLQRLSRSLRFRGSYRGHTVVQGMRNLQQCRRGKGAYPFQEVRLLHMSMGSTILGLLRSRLSPPNRPSTSPLTLIPRGSCTRHLRAVGRQPKSIVRFLTGSHPMLP